MNTKAGLKIDLFESPQYSFFQQPTELSRGGHFGRKYSIENIEYCTAELGNKADYCIKYWFWTHTTGLSDKNYDRYSSSTA